MQGSPLHPWGIPLKVNTIFPKPRITPTSVGNTNRIEINDKGVKDHPYIRGEYLIPNRSQVSRAGSPLHPWGILTLFGSFY